MNITFDQVVMLILFVTAAGTIWNYFVLQKRFVRLSKLYRKDIKDEDVEMIIKLSKFLESSKYGTATEHMKKIELTLQNYHDSCSILATIFNDIYTMENNSEIIDYMNKQLGGDYYYAINLFAATADLWPEFITKEVVERDDGKKI